VRPGSVKILRVFLEMRVAGTAGDEGVAIWEEIGRDKVVFSIALPLKQAGCQMT
jgi:hypothetical protein